MTWTLWRPWESQQDLNTAAVCIDAALDLRLQTVVALFSDMSLEMKQTESLFREPFLGILPLVDNGHKGIQDVI